MNVIVRAVGKHPGAAKLYVYQLEMPDGTHRQVVSNLTVRELKTGGYKVAVPGQVIAVVAEEKTAADSADAELDSMDSAPAASTARDSAAASTSTSTWTSTDLAAATSTSTDLAAATTDSAAATTDSAATTSTSTATDSAEATSTSTATDASFDQFVQFELPLCMLDDGADDDDATSASAVSAADAGDAVTDAVGAVGATKTKKPKTSGRGAMRQRQKASRAAASGATTTREIPDTMTKSTVSAMQVRGVVSNAMFVPHQVLLLADPIRTATKQLFSPWPDTPHFNDVVKYIKAVNRRSIGNKSITIKSIKFQIKAKLDGTNAAVSVHKKITAQRRNGMCTPSGDNAGFATWLAQHSDVFARLDNCIVFGEWVGEKVQKRQDAICRIRGRCLCVFAIVYHAHGTDATSDVADLSTTKVVYDPAEIRVILADVLAAVPDVKVIDYHGEPLEFTVDDPKPFEDAMNAHVAATSKLDEWTFKTFGVKGPGEGFVCYPVSVTHEDGSTVPVDTMLTMQKYLFKAKTEAHAVKHTRKPVQADTEIAESHQAFASMMVTQPRCEQMSKDLPKTPDGYHEFLKKLMADIDKEGKNERPVNYNRRAANLAIAQLAQKFWDDYAPSPASAAPSPSSAAPSSSAPSSPVTVVSQGRVGSWDQLLPSDRKFLRDVVNHCMQGKDSNFDPTNVCSMCGCAVVCNDGAIEPTVIAQVQFDGLTSYPDYLEFEGRRVKLVLEAFNQFEPSLAASLSAASSSAASSSAASSSAASSSAASLSAASSTKKPKPSKPSKSPKPPNPEIQVYADLVTDNVCASCHAAVCEKDKVPTTDSSGTVYKRVWDQVYTEIQAKSPIPETTSRKKVYEAVRSKVNDWWYRQFPHLRPE